MFWAFLLSFSLAAQLKYTNPVIAGNFPDPSIVRVDDKTQRDLHIDPYWAVTTGENGPRAFPLFHSNDLVHWERAKPGWVLHNPPDWTAGAYWAPEISEGPDHKFYVFYSALCDVEDDPHCPAEAKSSKNPHCLGVAIADAPGGPYRVADTPLVCDQWGSIDPMAYWDQKAGKQYLFWKEDTNNCKCPETTKIWAQEFKVDKTRPSWIKLEGDKPTDLIENDFKSWEDKVVEGPFVLRHGNYFYLFYAGAACCEADQCNYAEGVARATSPLGPYFKDPANPILADNASWKCPGHGSIVTTPDCRMFLLHHAFPRKPEGGEREAVLDEIEWKPDGWPTINDYRGVTSEVSVPSRESKERDCEDQR
jgi:xylan 1,4-beta-xylosidase